MPENNAMATKGLLSDFSDVAADAGIVVEMRAGFGILVSPNASCQNPCPRKSLRNCNEGSTRQQSSMKYLRRTMEPESTTKLRTRRIMRAGFNNFRKNPLIASVLMESGPGCQIDPPLQRISEEHWPC